MYTIDHLKLFDQNKKKKVSCSKKYEINHELNSFCLKKNALKYKIVYLQIKKLFTRNLFRVGFVNIVFNTAH